MKKIILNPVGFVRNSVKTRGDMSMQGAVSKIEILPRYRKALLRINTASHIWVLCYFHKADRSVLRAKPRKISALLGEKGVFAMRSPDRPNPVALSCVRLVSAKNGVLTTGNLDAIDGTPVIDIKPYSVGIDSVPCAKQPDFSKKYRLVSDKFLANTIVRSALNACGKPDKDILSACTLVFKYIRTTGASPNPSVEAITAGGISNRGLDALYAIFSLSPSCGRITAQKSATPFLTVKTKKADFSAELSAGDLPSFKKLLTIC